MRIALLGNSVPLFVRPPRRDRDERLYAEWLEIDGPSRLNVAEVRLSLLASRARMVTEIGDDLQAALGLFPDVAILHFGNVESATRTRARADYLALDPWLNPDFGGRMRDRLRRLAIGARARLVERTVGLLRRPAPWMSLSTFERALRHASEFLAREAAARVLIVNQAPISDRVESAAPGTRVSARRFDAAMARVASDTGAALVDVHSLCVDEGLETLAPDGIHFSALGHRRLADLVLAVLARPVKA